MYMLMTNEQRSTIRKAQGVPEENHVPDDVPASGCNVIIAMESGVVADILPTGPIKAVVVDPDMIENDDPYEQRMRKAVLPIAPDGLILTSDMPVLIDSLVREYRRPERRRKTNSSGGTETG
jgi:hypothetical protein